MQSTLLEDGRERIEVSRLPATRVGKDNRRWALSAMSDAARWLHCTETECVTDPESGALVVYGYRIPRGGA